VRNSVIWKMQRTAFPAQTPQTETTQNHRRGYGFFGYAIVNFLFFMTKAPSGGGGANPPAVVWRGFSGHWMAFYSAALAILYSAARTADTALRCANGHLASPNAIYCTQCGQPVMRVR
jgi:CubicO group peptidase (beta-lactamase class C family)